MKKLLLVLVVLLASFTLASCNNDDSKAVENTSGGSTLRIATWNTEFADRFNAYYKDKGLMPEGVDVEFVTTANQDNAYQDNLDTLLKNNATASADKKIDIFLIEADYATKYVDSDYSLDVINEIGLTTSDVSEQYEYTKDITTANDKLKGVSWQATPGAYIYRRSYANEIFGTDDPTEVQKELSSWDKFDEAAAKAKEKGIYMLSGFDDAFRVFSNNVTSPWVDEDKKVSIDPQIDRWIDQTKTYTEKGYNNQASLWSTESSQGMQENGNVLGYFGPSWFMDFVMADQTLADPDGAKELGNGSWGDWAMTQGPEPFFWGGTWLCGAAGTDNLDLVKDVMKVMTCDEETLVGITQQYGDFTNNVSAMTELANDPDYKYAFLGGQNHIAVLLDIAQNIQMKYTGPYDQGCVEELQTAMKDYFSAATDITKEDALANFYKAIKVKYPALSK